MAKELREQPLAAWRSFLTAHALIVEQIDQDLSAAGQVPLGWYDVLIELTEAPERRLRMNELARKVVLSRSGLTRLVDRIEAEGLLRRELDPTDRRGFYAILTDKGRAALRRAWPIYAQGISNYFARHFSNQEAQEMEALLMRVIDGMNQAVEGKRK